MPYSKFPIIYLWNLHIYFDLPFAAKRLSDFDVFQILTDAALLKRQKLEIEELRSKLQVPR